MDELFEVTQHCVSRDLIEANVYHRLLFQWMNGVMAHQMFYSNFAAIFKNVEDALETKYVFALSKLFGDTSEHGLWKLILLARDVSQTEIDLKLEQLPPFVKPRHQHWRQDFLGKFDDYVRQIQLIREKISPLRNIQRAHNHPLTPESAPVLWKDSREWLAFGEEVYVQAMDGICEGCPRVGDFLPRGIDSQINWFNSTIKDWEASNDRTTESIRSPLA